MLLSVTLRGFDEVKRRLNLDNAGFRIGSAALRGMNSLVPYDTGKLRQGAYAGDMKVIYSRGVDYAGYVYRGRGHARYPGTSLTWPEDYQAKGMPEVVEEIRRVIGGH